MKRIIRAYAELHKADAMTMLSDEKIAYACHFTEAAQKAWLNVLLWYPLRNQEKVSRSAIRRECFKARGGQVFAAVYEESLPVVV